MDITRTGSTESMAFCGPLLLSSRKCCVVSGGQGISVFQALTSNNQILTPAEKHWFEFGETLGKMKVNEGFDAPKLRDLHFDILIALTAKSWGATLITSNRSDFELIRKYRDFEPEIW